MQQSMHLVLTGGGTGGHIIPNIALIQELKKRYSGTDQLKLLYIGSRNGMEEKMIKDLGVRYEGIFTGKIRRYFSWQNFLDLVKVPIGIVQALFILLRFKPRAVFCKGGFVSFPVAVAAWMARVPVVLHESDVVPGLANKISGKFANKICISFEESRNYFSSEKDRKKLVLTGNPVRKEISEGGRQEGHRFSGLNGDKPVILVMGGSQGAQAINELIWGNLDDLLRDYQVVHICGKGKVRDLNKNGYSSHDFVGSEMKHLYALADIIVTRSGAITLAELAVIGKPAILIPLGKKASRGDQIDNANAYVKEYNASVIEEESLTKEVFLKEIRIMLDGQTVKSSTQGLNAAEKIITLLEEV